MLVSILSHYDKVKLIFWSELIQKSSQETRRLIKNDILGRKKSGRKVLFKIFDPAIRNEDSGTSLEAR